VTDCCGVALPFRAAISCQSDGPRKLSMGMINTTTLSRMTGPLRQLVTSSSLQTTSYCNQCRLLRPSAIKSYSIQPRSLSTTPTIPKTQSPSPSSTSPPSSTPHYTNRSISSPTSSHGKSTTSPASIQPDKSIYFGASTHRFPPEVISILTQPISSQDLDVDDGA
jgi:hypothetical protein